MYGVTLCTVLHFALCEKWIQEMTPQIQEVTPTDSRDGPHHVCGVALCSMWHFVLCREWILEAAPMDSRGDTHHVYGVALSSI